jgi:hypothetical protein
MIGSESSTCPPTGAARARRLPRRRRLARRAALRRRSARPRGSARPRRSGFAGSRAEFARAGSGSLASAPSSRRCDCSPPTASHFPDDSDDEADQPGAPTRHPGTWIVSAWIGDPGRAPTDARTDSGRRVAITRVYERRRMPDLARCHGSVRTTGTVRRVATYSSRPRRCRNSTRTEQVSKKSELRAQNKNPA